MDTILTGLLNFGVGGAMAGAVVYLVYQALTRTIPELTERHRLELADQRERYHQLLRSEHETFQATLAAVEARNGAAVESLCRAMEAIQRQVEEQAVLLAEIHGTVRRCCEGRAARAAAQGGDLPRKGP